MLDAESARPPKAKYPQMTQMVSTDPPWIPMKDAHAGRVHHNLIYGLCGAAVSAAD
jgi:hypothetical protein